MKFFIKPPHIFSKLSFRKKIMISLIILSLLLTVYMGASSYQLSSNIIFNMSKKLSEYNFDVVYKSLENYFENVGKYSTLLIRIPALRDILQAKHYTHIPQKTGVSGMDTHIREILSLASSTDKITFNTVNIYCKNGYNYNYYERLNFPYSDYESCINYYLNKNYISTGYKAPTWCDVIETFDSSGCRSFSFINFRVLYDPATLEEVGILITGIKEDDLFSIYSGFSEKAFIMHRNGLIISHPDKSKQGTAFNDMLYTIISGSTKSKDTLNIATPEGMQLVTFKKLAGNDAYFIVPFDYFSGKEVFEAHSFTLNVIILVLIGFATSILFAILLSKGLSSSVLSLKKTVQAVHDGDLSARYISDKNDEVAYLGRRFNEMLEQINSFFKKQKEQEIAKKTLELKLMQSQINPHLLYNTLDSVLWALDNRNLARAKEIIVALSNFFKISLSGGHDLIPIQKELELIRNYINIQKAARNKNITLNINIPDELYGVNIIKLSIQPIVENAVLHGFSGFRDDGLITISMEQSPDKKSIEIMVEDNGIGIPEQKLALINEILSSEPTKDGIMHFGLYNVQRRLKTNFGDEYGIRFASEMGNFTRVFMTIPANPVMRGGSEENV